MKASMVSLLMIAAFLAMAFAVAPAQAGEKTTDYTGTMTFVDWENVSLAEVGPTVHAQSISQWWVDATDPRVSGMYILDGKCMWPHGEWFGWGPCQAKWTLDANADGQSDWEGQFTVSPQLDRVYFWGGTGQGLGEYAGMHVSFKIYDGQVVGRITEN